MKIIKRNGIPVVLNQNGVYFSGWYGNGWENKNKKLIPAYHLSDYIFWQSEFCKESADKFLGKKNIPGEVLFNAVDTTKFYNGNKSAGTRARKLSQDLKLEIKKLRTEILEHTKNKKSELLIKEGSSIPYFYFFNPSILVGGKRCQRGTV